MNKGTGTYIAIIVIAIVAVAVFFLADFGSKSYATPEEVIAGMRAAAQKGDVRTWFECLTEESRDFMVARVVLTEHLSMRDPITNKKDNEAVLKIFQKNGLTEEFLNSIFEREGLILSDDSAPPAERVKAAKKIVSPIGDRGAFLEDIFKSIHKNPLDDWRDVKVAGVQVEGKIAVGIGTLVRPVRFVFRKVGESWRLDIIAMTEANEPRMPKGFKHPPIDR